MKRLKQITIVLVLSGFIFTQNPYAQNNIVKTNNVSRVVNSIECKD